MFGDGRFPAVFDRIKPGSHRCLAGDCPACLVKRNARLSFKTYPPEGTEGLKIMLESLENRKLLTATLNGNDLVVDGTNGNDTITLSLSGTGANQKYSVAISGQATQQFLVSDIGSAGSITINGL